jgi:hypothetical protein
VEEAQQDNEEIDNDAHDNLPAEPAAPEIDPEEPVPVPDEANQQVHKYGTFNLVVSHN